MPWVSASPRGKQARTEVLVKIGYDELELRAQAKELGAT